MSRQVACLDGRVGTLGVGPAGSEGSPGIVGVAEVVVKREIVPPVAGSVWVVEEHGEWLGCIGAVTLVERVDGD